MTVTVSDVKEVAKELSDRFSAFEQKHTERYDAIEKELTPMLLERNRPAGGGGGFGGAGSLDGKSALRAYITKGDDSQLQKLQSKSMQTGIGEDGGFAVPVYLDKEVENLERSASALVRLARTVEAEGSVYKKIVNLGGSASGWAGETDARPETATPKIASVDIAIGELFANPKLTQRMVDDVMFDAEAYISGEIANEFSSQMATALFNGDGVNKPKGVLTYTITAEKDGVRAFGTLQAVKTATAAVITFDDIKALKSSLNAQYRPGAAFVMNSETALALSLIKDLNGAYVWTSSTTEGQPDLLLGSPVEIDENAPDIATGAYPVLFGNFDRGYTIARRFGVRLLRDPYSSKPFINFYTTARVGGAVVNSDCIKLLEVK